MSQAYLYVPAFEERMLSLLEIDKSYWQQVAQTNGEITTFGNLSHKHIGELLRSIYIERCFIACYDGNPGKKNKLWEDSCISTLDFM